MEPYWPESFGEQKSEPLNGPFKRAMGNLLLLTLEDLLISTHQEFKESEIFPSDDSAEEWLKLLDYHPDQVVGVSSLKPGKNSEEHRISQIV